MCIKCYRYLSLAQQLTLTNENNDKVTRLHSDPYSFQCPLDFKVRRSAYDSLAAAGYPDDFYNFLHFSILVQ
jgi:hypothetical protein